MSIEQVIANHRKFRTFGQPPVAAFCLSCLSRTRFGKLDSGIVGVLGWSTKFCGWGEFLGNLWFEKWGSEWGWREVVVM